MIIINNKKYEGNSITISGNKIIIDGVDQTPDAKVINISVDGNIQNINADVCDTIKISGNCGAITTTSGDVECEGDINGSINTMSGDVRCKNVSGNVKTMSGDIRHKNITF